MPDSRRPSASQMRTPTLIDGDAHVHRAARCSSRAARRAVVARDGDLDVAGDHRALRATRPCGARRRRRTTAFCPLCFATEIVTAGDGPATGLARRAFRGGTCAEAHVRGGLLRAVDDRARRRAGTPARPPAAPTTTSPTSVRSRARCPSRGGTRDCSPRPRPPGRRWFAAPSAVATASGERWCAAIRSGSSRTRTWRRSPPVSVTSLTPGTCLICSWSSAATRRSS